MSWLALLAAVAWPGSVRAQAAADGNALRSCVNTAQAFYDWYVPPWIVAELERPNAMSRLDGPVWERWRRLDPLTKRRAMFEPALLRALDDDRAAQARVTGEIVGLDFDPYIGGQSGPLGAYVVERPRLTGDRCRVDVRYVVRGKKSADVAVAPELVSHGRVWRFANFRYADTDLISVLRALRDDRGKRRR